MMAPSRIRVLLIDDEPDLCAVVKDFLSRSGEFQIATANSVKEAREAMATRQFDVVVSDYQMPREDGIQLLKSLRASGNGTPFILFTGKGREEVVIEAINSGADFYLQKGGMLAPMYSELAHKIRAAARRHSAETSLRQSESMYRALFDSSVDPIALIDQNGIILSANGAAGRLLGRAPKDIIGLNPRQMGLFSEDGMNDFFSRMNAPRGAEAAPAIYLLEIGDTGPRWIELNFSSVDMGRGQVITQVIVRDITDRHLALQVREEALRAHRELAANIPGLVYRLSLSPERSMTFFNDMVLELTGYRTDELVQGDVCSIDPLIVQEDRASVTLAVREAIAQGEPFQVEYRLRRKDDVVVHLFEKGRPVMDPDGKAIYIDGVIFDDERRKLVLLHEREAQERFQSLFSNTMDMVVYHEMVRDAEGGAVDYRLVDCNDAFCRVSGIEASSAKGALASRLFGQEGPPFIAVYEEVARTGRSKRFDAHFEPIGRHFRITAVKAGEDGFATITQDITEDVHRERTIERAKDEIEAANQQLKAIEEELRQQLDEVQYVNDALRESEERYRMLVESSTDGVIVHLRGIVVFANQAMADILGYATSKEMIGSNSLDFLEPSQREAVAARVMKAASSEQPAIRENLVRADGRVITALVSARPLSAMGGRSAMVVVRDITEEIRTNQEVTRLNADLTLQNEINKIMLLGSGGELDRRLLEVALRELDSSFGFIGHVDGSLLQIDALNVGNGCKVPDPRLAFPRTTWGAIWGRSIDERATLKASGIHLPHGHITLQTLLCVPLLHRDHALGVIAVADRHGGYGQEEQRRLEAIAAHISPFVAAKLEKKAVEEERQMAEKALAEVNRKLQLMTGVTRHDIINQLMVLRGNLSLASTERDEMAAQHLYAKAMAAADNIESMIRFTKEYQEMGMQAPVWQKLRPLVEKAEAALYGKAMAVEDHLPDIEVWSDPLLLKVFANLFDNTVRHSGGATLVDLGAWEEGGEMQVVYADNGQGIRREDKGRLFERGFGKNTGYGLFFAREILEMTGISIYEDGEPGRGARFVITVPRECWRPVR